MLVEFSPWETADTSLRLSQPKKRPRKGDLPTTDDFLIAGSPVLSRSTRRKKRTNHDDRSRSIFTITSPHRVTVLVEKNKGFSAGAPTTEAADAACSVHESSHFQYTSRPGDATAFLSPNARKISAVFDAKNDSFFALQDGNKRLVVWDAQEEGPAEEDTNSKGSVQLKSRATGLALLPRGVVVGSCEDGSVFYANLEEDDENATTLKVQYLSLASEKLPQGAQHAGMFVTAKEHKQGPGKKRKASRGDDDAKGFELYQIFVVGSNVTMKRHELLVVMSDTGNFSLERQTCRIATLSLLPPGVNEQSFVVEEPMLMPMMSGHPETATLIFKLQHEQQKHYCCSFRIHSAELEHPPFPVPCSRQHSALINQRVLAMKSEDQIILCDAMNGVVLHSEPLPAVLQEVDDWVLLSDTRKGHLLILANVDGTLQVTKSTVSLEPGQPLQFSSTMSLAARLSAALNASSDQTLPLMVPAPKSLAVLTKETNLKKIPTENSVTAALDMLRKAESKIAKDTGEYKAGLLVDTYESAVESLSQAIDKAKKVTEKQVDKIQSELEAVSKRARVVSVDKADSAPVERLNGCHDTKSPKRKLSSLSSNPTNEMKSPSSVTKLMNGSHPERDAQESTEGEQVLPFAFVDSATALVIRILLQTQVDSELSEKKSFAIQSDCCLVLHRLLATGKVSARRHFDSDKEDDETGNYFMAILRAMEGKQTKEQRVRSPVDFMEDMLRYSSDVSESQMVTMLHYMFCWSRPADIAFAFLDSKDIPSNHANKTLSFRYFKYAEQVEAENGKGSPDLKEKLEKIASRLLLAGSAALLEGILTYSHCNQALLCMALREGLSFGRESGLLCRLLGELAFQQRPSSTYSASGSEPPFRQQQNIVVSAGQWIPAVFDAFGDRLSGVKKNDDSKKGDYKDDYGDTEKNLQHLQECLAAARRQTEQILELEDVINASWSAASKRQLANEKENEEEEITGQPTKRKVEWEEDTLPAYSVERLII